MRRVHPKRFFHDAKRHKNAGTSWATQRASSTTPFPDGALNPRRGLIQYRNGSAEKPRPGRPAGVHLTQSWACRHFVMGRRIQEAPASKIIQKTSSFHPPAQSPSLRRQQRHYFRSQHARTPQAGCGSNDGLSTDNLDFDLGEIASITPLFRPLEDVGRTIWVHATFALQAVVGTENRWFPRPLIISDC